MEQLKYNGAQQNSPNVVFLILSILSWLLLAINNLASLRWLYREYFTVWNIYMSSSPIQIFIQAALSGDDRLRLRNLQSFDISLPLTIEKETIYKIFNFFFIISIIGCATFIFKTLIKKDQTIIDGMFGKYSKFHFIPLLFGFVMSLLGEIIDEFNLDDIAYSGLAISLIGLACMIFVYINTNINSNEWWVSYVLNKGTFSCLIILFWYNFCYDIYLVRMYDKIEDFLKWYEDWYKGVNLAFSIIFGIGSMIFSFVFKDIIICLINIFIYNDLAGKNIYLIAEEPKEYLKNVNYNGDGAIDYIILICSFLLLIYIVVEKVKGMIEQMKNQIVYLDSYQKQIVNGVNAHTQSINQIANLINSNKKNE